MPAVPEGREMRVPLVTERKNEILHVAMIRSADEKMAAGPKHLLREARQIARSNEMLDHLSSDSHIEARVANRGGIVIYSELMEHQLGRRIFSELHAVGARLARRHPVESLARERTRVASSRFSRASGAQSCRTSPIGRSFVSLSMATNVFGSGSCLPIPMWPQNKAWISSAPAMILMRPSTIPCAISA